MMNDVSQCKLLQQLGSLRDVIWHLRFTKKYVEDDTCMDRIITALEVSLNSNENKKTVSDFLATDKCGEILSNCHHIMRHANNYHASSSGFATKLFACLAGHDWVVEEICTNNNWNDCIKIYSAMLNCGEEMSQSYQFAWLSSFVSITSCRRSLLAILQNDFNVNNVAELTSSSSIFVQRCAHKVLAVLIKQLFIIYQETEVNKDQHDVAKKVLRNLSLHLKSNCSTETSLQVIGESISINFKAAYGFVEQFLNDDNKLYFESASAKEVLFKQAQSGNQNLVNFIANLMNKTDFSKKLKENVIYFSTIYDIGVSALMNNITSSVGYSLIGHLAFYPEKRKRCVEIIMTSFQVVLIEKCEIESNEILTKLEKLLINTFTSRSKLTSVLCNSTSTLCKLWKADLLLSDEREWVISFFLQSLTSIFALSSTQNSLPQLIQNWKVALSILECFENCINVTQSAETTKYVNNLTSLQDVLVQILSHTDADQLMVKKCGNLLINFLRFEHDNLNNQSELITLTCQGISTKLMDRRWKVKDSALEIFSILLDLFEKESSFYSFQKILEKCIIDCDMLNLVLLSLKDENSYVRASAFKCIQLLYTNTKCFNSEKCKVDLFSTILKILTEDTEAFARRAAVVTLSFCICHNKNILILFLYQFVDENINIVNVDDPLTDLDLVVNQSALTLRDHVLINDLDWEVRRNGVNFLEKITKIITNSNIFDNKTYKNLTKEKIFNNIKNILKTLSSDCDTAVQDSATDLLRHLNNEHDVTIDYDVIRKLDAFNWEFGSLLEDVLHRLKSDNPIILSHHSQTDDNTINDDVILDCY